MLIETMTLWPVKLNLRIIASRLDYVHPLLNWLLYNIIMYTYVILL